MFSMTSSSGRSWKSWNTSPTVSHRQRSRVVCESAVRSRSPQDTAPALGCSNPATACNKVVLPVPEGPVMATIAPGSTARLMRSRIWRAGREPSARSTTRSVMANGDGRRTAGSAAPESGIDDADLAYKPGLRIGPRPDFEPPRDHDRFPTGDHRRGTPEVDNDDIC